MIFNYPIKVLVESRERPPAFIGMQVLKGNLKKIDGSYRIEKVGEQERRYALRWSGTIESPALLPLLITAPLMRANISAQFRGMVKEIERREALQRGKQVVSKD